MHNKELFKQKLIMMKDSVIQRISAIQTDVKHEGMSADWDDQAIERENDEVLNGLWTSAEQELGLINSALKRIDRDEYFQCSLCNNEISIERLELLPFSLHCVDCAEKLEH